VHGKVVVVSREKGAKKDTETPCDKGPVTAYLNKKHDGHKQGSDTSDSQGQYNNLKADYVGDTVPSLWVMMDPMQKELYADPVETNLGSPDKRTDPTVVGAPNLMVHRQTKALAENNLIEGAWYSAAVIETQGVLVYLNVVNSVLAENIASSLLYEVEDALNAKEGDNYSRFLNEVHIRLSAFTEAHPAVKDEVNELAKSIGATLAYRVVHRELFAKE